MDRTPPRSQGRLLGMDINSARQQHQLGSTPPSARMLHTQQPRHTQSHAVLRTDEFVQRSNTIAGNIIHNHVRGGSEDSDVFPDVSWRNSRDQAQNAIFKSHKSGNAPSAPGQQQVFVQSAHPPNSASSSAQVVNNDVYRIQTQSGHHRTVAQHNSSIQQHQIFQRQQLQHQQVLHFRRAAIQEPATARARSLEEQRHQHHSKSALSFASPDILASTVRLGSAEHLHMNS